MIDEEISQKDAIIDSSNSNESVLSNENENGSKTNVADGSGEIKKESVLINSSNQMQQFYKEKPKVPSKKADNDIEEFDTDEEDESTNQNSTKQTCSDNISYEGDKCIYTEPGTGRKLLWNTNENKWGKWPFFLTLMLPTWLNIYFDQIINFVYLFNSSS